VSLDEMSVDKKALRHCQDPGNKPFAGVT